MEATTRARIMADLRARRELTVKAICERYKISRSTFTRLNRKVTQKTSSRTLTR